jgi:hypothetical protein
MTLQEQDVMLRQEATNKIEEAKKYLDGDKPDMCRAELLVRQALDAVMMVRDIDGSKG